jgi:signal transduction histidine kinase
VEDNSVVRQVAEEMLSGFGCLVDWAHDGSEAVKRWSEKRYDLILMDCMMPGMDGFAAARQIRLQEQVIRPGDRCPIIALTAHAGTLNSALCSDAGMDDYLRKPFTRHELAVILKRWSTWSGAHHRPDELFASDAPSGSELLTIFTGEQTFRDYARHLVENEESLRKNLATELHDELGRAITTLSLTFGMIGASLPDEVKRGFLGERLRDAQGLIEEASTTIGNIMFGLRPAVLEDFGLAATIRRHAELFEKSTGILVDVEGVAECTSRLTATQELAMYRVYQEAMLNASRHGNPSFITVIAGCNDGRTMLGIIDDGRGFDPETRQAASSGTGWGLMLMRERIEAVGGQLHLRSCPGEGTVITAEIRENP